MNDVCELATGNSLYDQHRPPFVARENILADMQALPPGKTRQDKYFETALRPPALKKKTTDTRQW